MAEVPLPKTMRSPCLTCDKAHLDKNKCKKCKSCKVIKEFQAQLDGDRTGPVHKDDHKLLVNILEPWFSDCGGGILTENPTEDRHAA